MMTLKVFFKFDEEMGCFQLFDDRKNVVTLQLFFELSFLSFLLYISVICGDLTLFMSMTSNLPQSNQL